MTTVNSQNPHRHLLDLGLEGKTKMYDKGSENSPHTAEEFNSTWLSQTKANRVDLDIWEGKFRDISGITSYALFPNHMVFAASSSI